MNTHSLTSAGDGTPEPKKLSVLSLGFTVSLLENQPDEDRDRLLLYAEHLNTYFHIILSPRERRDEPTRLRSNMTAYPACGRLLPIRILRTLRLARRLLSTHRFDLIQAQDPLITGPVAALLGRQYGIPFVTCVFGANVYDVHWLRARWKNRLMAPLGRAVLDRSASIQVDGRLTAQRLIEKGHRAEKVHVKPMVPGNIEQFLKIPEDRSSGDIVRILFVGRLAAQKNLPILFGAFRELLLKLPGKKVELVIVGAGEESERLEKLAASLGIASSTRFCGAAGRQEVVRYFAEADIFALSSDFEGFPRVLMEAAAAALPIVTTAVSGADEAVVHEETGFIVDVGDSVQMANHLCRLVSCNPTRKRMGAQGRRRIAQRLDPCENAHRQLLIWNATVDRRTPVAATASA